MYISCSIFNILKLYVFTSLRRPQSHLCSHTIYSVTLLKQGLYHRLGSSCNDRSLPHQLMASARSCTIYRGTEEERVKKKYGFLFTPNPSSFSSLICVLLFEPFAKMIWVKKLSSPLNERCTGWIGPVYWTLDLNACSHQELTQTWPNY